MRAGQVKENVEALDSLGDRAAHVRASLDATDVAMIEGASRLAWLPVRIDIALTEAVARVCGLDAMREWSKISIRRSFAKPLLQPIIAGAVQVFGLSPTAFYRVVARGFGNVYRNCGELDVVDVDHDGCTVRWRDVAAEVSDVYLEGVAATFLAILEVTQVKGHTVVKREGNEVRFAVHWLSDRRILERKR